MESFTAIEKDRLNEILFYYFFNNKSTKILQKGSFWATIQKLCETYDINGISVSIAARTLFLDDNRPTELESWYLLHKLGASVRAIKAITGIYWQKQQHFAQTIENYGTPTITRRITHVGTKSCIKAFISATQDFLGVLAPLEGACMNAYLSM